MHCAPKPLVTYELNPCHRVFPSVRVKLHQNRLNQYSHENKHFTKLSIRVHLLAQERMIFEKAIQFRVWERNLFTYEIIISVSLVLLYQIEDCVRIWDDSQHYSFHKAGM